MRLPLAIKLDDNNSTVKLSLSQCQCQHPPSVGRLSRGKAVQCQFSVNLYLGSSLLSTQYQVGCLFQVTIVALSESSDSSRKMVYWLSLSLQIWDQPELTTKLNKLSETDKLVDLFSTSFSLPVHQSSSSNSHSKLKSIKILSDLRFDKAKFSCCCLHEATNLLQIVLWNGKGRPENQQTI